MHQFYAPEIESALCLPEEESQHAIRVLRLKAGDEIEVIDGKGNRYLCKVSLAHQKKCGVEIVDKRYNPPHWGCDITLAIAPTKNNDRIEWMAEKVTEMGINRIIPIKCRFSERKELKTLRLSKILISAMKQSLKSTLPQLDEMTPIEKILKMDYSGKKFIAYCDKEIERKEFSKEYAPGENALIMVGPEGDFSKEEIKMALDNGFIPISFGMSRLRTETAGMYACAAIHAINQRKNE